MEIVSLPQPRDSYTECSKSDTERKISYDIAYTWNLRKSGGDT